MTAQLNDNLNTNLNDILINSEKTNEHLPCNNCDGDCCGPVPFGKIEIIEIFNKYDDKKYPKFKKRFPWNERTIHKHVGFRQSYPHNNEIITPFFKKAGTYIKGGIDKNSCIFKDNGITGGCLIYEDRPVICKEYGLSKLLKCPYAGLKEQPKDEETKKSLVREGFQTRNQTLLEMVSDLTPTPIKAKERTIYVI